MSREVPEGWRTVDLGDVAKESRARNSALSISEERLVGVFKEEGMVPMRDRVRGASVERCKVVKPGDFAYNPMRINIGSIARSTADTNLMVSPDYVVFSPDINKIDGLFLDYLRKSDTWAAFVGNAGDGGVRIRIYFEHLARFRFNLPPLHEQRRIAEILSSADEAIAATRAVVEQTKKVKQGVLERLLTKGIGHTRFKQSDIGEIPEGWDVAPVEAYLARLIDYRGVPPPKSESGVPLITAKNVRFGYLNPEPREYISEDDFDGWMRRGLPEAGDVLFTTEAPLGNVAQIPDYKIALGQRTITLCPDRTRLKPTFLKWLLISPGSQARLAENATGSTALGIKQSTFRKLLFPFPSVDEQETIANHIDGIDAAEAAETSKLENLTLLKAALMSDLLTGRKRVTDALPLAAE